MSISISWHQHLGHPTIIVVSSVISKHSLPIYSNNTMTPCDAYRQAKSHRFHLNKCPSLSLNPLDLIFSDV